MDPLSGRALASRLATTGESPSINDVLAFGDAVNRLEAENVDRVRDRVEELNDARARLIAAPRHDRIEVVNPMRVGRDGRKDGRDVPARECRIHLADDRGIGLCNLCSHEGMIRSDSYRLLAHR